MKVRHADVTADLRRQADPPGPVLETTALTKRFGSIATALDDRTTAGDPGLTRLGVVDRARRVLCLGGPTNGRAPAGRTAMLEPIARIGADFGISVVVASHPLGEIEQICDHLSAIHAGRLLRAAPISSFTQASQVLAI